MRSLVVVIALLVVGCSDERSAYELRGYFKSASKDRVFTYRLPETYILEDVRKFASSLANSEGQMTAAYFYDYDAKLIPADAITYSKSLVGANAWLDHRDMDRWRFAYMHYRNGSEILVNCGEEKHDLCR